MPNLLDASYGVNYRKVHPLLLMDRDANHLIYLTMLLQRLGYRIWSASSAEEASDLSAMAMPSLIIVSVGIAQTDDLSLVERLRTDPRTASIPVIALLPEGDLIGEQRCRAAGVRTCLSRPVQAEELYRSIQRIVEPNPRRNIRIPLQLPVSLDNHALDFAAGECVTELSAQGVNVRTVRPAPVHARLAVRITLGGRPVSADAVVLYSSRSDSGVVRGSGMGLAFDRIAPEDEEYIRRYIRDKVLSGLR
jgi:CheY-like chemotaxis protein